MFIILPLSAQLPDDSIAPDWVLTDIEGQEHQLYDYLDQGMTVFIDFTATWCDPCWVYQNRNHLDRLYHKHGPNGSKELMVFMIEGDPATTLEDLEGTGSNTLGNWIENTSYPIINDASITELYQVGYWPTIYKICPDKRIELIGTQNYSTLYACLNRCEGPRGTNNAAILSYEGESGFFCGNIQVAPKLVIQNEGSANLTSCVINFYNNGELMQSKVWSGDLAPHTTNLVRFDQFNIQEDASFKFRLHSPNNQNDEAPEYNIHDQTRLMAPVAGPMITLRLHTDYWPEEISWTLKEDNGTVLHSSEDYTLEANTAYEYNFELDAEGCYELEVVDTYGDGLVNGPVGGGQVAHGAISLESRGEVLWSDNSYGFGVTIPFEMSTVLVNTQELTLAVETLTMRPNPARDAVQLDFSLVNDSQLDISIYDLLGRQILQLPQQSFSAGQHQLPIDLSAFEEGMYLLQFFNHTTQSQHTRKLMVRK
ncbi:MAG: T9SS type A sorting domain-containing protein [Bacteroidota bacterium]